MFSGQHFEGAYWSKKAEAPCDQILVHDSVIVSVTTMSAG